MYTEPRVKEPSFVNTSVVVLMKQQGTICERTHGGTNVSKGQNNIQEDTTIQEKEKNLSMKFIAVFYLIK